MEEYKDIEGNALIVYKKADATNVTNTTDVTAATTGG